MALADVLGWTGAVLVLGAYSLLSLGKLPPTSKLWAAMNILGAGALAWSAALDRRWPFVVLNSVWLAIGVSSLIKPPRAPITTVEDRRAGV